MGQVHPTARAPRTVHQEFDQLDGPTMDDIDLDDLDGIDDARRHQVQLDLLRVARISVLKDAISVCYKQYGPNHAVVCRPLYIEYLKKLDELPLGTKIRVNIPEVHPPKPAEEAHADGEEPHAE